MILAALATAVAVALLIPRTRSSSGGRAPLVLLACAAGAWAVARFDGSALVIAVVALAVGAVVLRLARSAAQTRRIDRRSVEVEQLCEQLAADLLAGVAPSQALRAASSTWGWTASVAQADEVGADVAEAWRELGRDDGAGGCRLIGAAWQVSGRSGGSLAPTLDRVAAELRADRATARVVRSELASARATARIVATLPLAALALGGGTGADPVGFLLDSAAGQVCLVAGLACGLVGWWWIERLAR